MEYVIALVALTAMEIVLGIDNIVFIAVITDRLPEHQQPRARKIGLLLAMAMRVALLFTLTLLIQWGEEPLFQLSSLGLPESILGEEVDEVSGKDLILFVGGLFLIWKSVVEIHKKAEGLEEEDELSKEPAKFGHVLAQIAAMDIVFSIDSVITAVGMVKSEGDKFWIGIAVMVTAIVISVGIMLIFAEPVSNFVKKHPTLKMLALSFLILIGVMLVAEGVGTHIDKGYIYFAMAFALIVEMLNMRMRKRIAPVTGAEAA